MSFFRKVSDVNGLRRAGSPQSVRKNDMSFLRCMLSYVAKENTGGLDVPANRKWFLDQIARGVQPSRAAPPLDIDVRTVQRYAKANPHFMIVYKEVKRDGREARKRVDGDVPLTPPPPAGARTSRAPRPRPPKKQAPPVADGYLEQYEKAEPEGMKLNAHLPPLSVKTLLAKCQSILHDKKEPVALRVESMKTIRGYTLVPILIPPPPRSETAAEAPARAAIPGGVRVQVVTMEAPDNGLYAPGRAPGQAQVVDDAEADDAEVVEARSS